jgi:hypothetical protein
MVSHSGLSRWIMRWIWLIWLSKKPKHLQKDSKLVLNRAQRKLLKKFMLLSRILMIQSLAILLENMPMNGAKQITTRIRLKNWPMTWLRKLINKVNNWIRTAMKISIRLTKMVLESQTGKDFHVLLSSSTHKVFGWHGDAKKWCGSHLMPILQTRWVFGKDLFKVLFTLVLLKERMHKTKSL